VDRGDAFRRIAPLSLGVVQRRDTSPAPTRRPAAREKDDRRWLGRLGEDLAAAHLERLGFTVLGRNVRTRYGEIDLIAFDGRTLVFAEVKTRRVSRRDRVAQPHHDPLASLRPRQRVRLRRLAVAWLSREVSRTDPESRPRAETIRFDAVGVVLDANDRLLRLDHLEGAW
jgi:putative endonuclease